MAKYCSGTLVVRLCLDDDRGDTALPPLPRRRGVVLPGLVATLQVGERIGVAIECVADEAEDRPLSA